MSGRLIPPSGYREWERTLWQRICRAWHRLTGYRFTEDKPIVLIPGRDLSARLLGEQAGSQRLEITLTLQGKMSEQYFIPLAVEKRIHHIYSAIPYAWNYLGVEHPQAKRLLDEIVRRLEERRDPMDDEERIHLALDRCNGIIPQ